MDINKKDLSKLFQYAIQLKEHDDFANRICGNFVSPTTAQPLIAQRLYF